MSRRYGLTISLAFTFLALVSAGAGRAAAPVTPTAHYGRDAVHKIEYPPRFGKLEFGVTYTLWVPKGVKNLRGIIVHQHGCGAGACKGGATAAYDLHWQALARKWNCALMGPSYHQDDTQNCRLWCDPRNGSDEAFMRSLTDLSVLSGHPELPKLPWALWGHSGGGFWASLMQAKYPERIVAIWFRSGTAFSYWEKGEIPKPDLPAAAMRIPMMGNPGVKERDDPRMATAWTGTFGMFEAYRAKGAPIGFAPDPRSSHECADSRYLAIPYFDACLAMRLPSQQGRPLKPVDESTAYLATPLTTEAVPAKEFQGNRSQAVWLPNRKVAEAWEEYVRTGATPDTTPPPAPHNVRAQWTEGVGVELQWEADADFESGLQRFVIVRDGKEIGQLPEKPIGHYGRPLFQTMSYHDTPTEPMPQMRFKDTSAGASRRSSYAVIAVNSVGLKSGPSKPPAWTP